MSSTEALFKRFYYERPGFVDGTTEFHALCARELSAGASILEIGAGPSNQTSRFLAGVGPTTGVDVSSEVLQNDALSNAVVYDGIHLPFEDGEFGACVSNYLLEHVESAGDHFAQVFRVLRPGGCYVFRTPNLWHYVALVSRVLPHNLHRVLANPLRKLPANAHEPWPTFYRANTRGDVTALATSAGFGSCELHMIEKEPYYARSGRMLFYPLMAYERLVNMGPPGEGIRANIFGVVRKAI